MGGKIPFLRVPWKTVGQVLWNLGLIIVGSCVCAVALNGILIPKGFVSGGVAGLALIVHHVIPNLPVSILYLIFNIPLFALGWKYVGRRFFLYSIVGTLIFSSAVQWIYIPIPVQDKFLCAILAGIIMGCGDGHYPSLCRLLGWHGHPLGHGPDQVCHPYGKYGNCL